jgi:murein tripeptide amidase MpaA
LESIDVTSINMTFDHYYLYNEITDLLKRLEKEHPKLAKLHSIGKTPQGRDIWLMELSNREKGNPDRKPGMYIDGNTHASEVTGSMVCLKTIWYLVSEYGRDPFATELLDGRVVYVNPRVDPDGAELFLTTPEARAGGGRLYPLTEEEWERAEGLVPDDVDGDGHITAMRVEDPNGDWKVSEKDPRLLVKRLPEDRGGRYYRRYTEGPIKNYRGQEIKVAPSKHGLNLNRNFPGEFEPHPKQTGAGPFPLSEPETRAVADFWQSHPNVGGVMTYHTNGGCLPRVFDAHPDDYFVDIECEQDLEIFKALGETATRMTGYEQVSSFDDFTRDKRKPRHGCTDGYSYLHLGIMGFCMELWDMPSQASLPGWKERGGMDFRWPHIKEEDALKLLEWNDDALKGEGFKPWTEFDHPQLGKVEIGGWRTKFTWRNPPPGKFLEEECERAFKFALVHASLLPLLKIVDAQAEKLGDGIYRVRVKAMNTGFQPTNLTQMAVKVGVAKPVIATIDPGEDAELLSPRPWVDLGHLEGRAERLPDLIRPPSPGEGHAATAEWLVKARKVPCSVGVRVSSQKAGEAEETVELS